MSIEVTRAKSVYQHRINPFNATCIDRRRNQHGAKWAHFSHHPTSWAAIEALLEIGQRFG